MKRWKTLTAALLAAAVLLPTAQAHSHPGVPELGGDYNCSPWAKEGVKAAVALEISMGWEDDYAVPATRSEFREVAMSYVRTSQRQYYLSSLVARHLAEKDADGNVKLVFHDSDRYPGLDEEEDYRNSIAYYLGLVDGRSPGYFEPTAQITRQEAAVMLARAYRVVARELPEVPAGDLPFTDSDQIAGWAKESVALMYHWGILQGKSDGSFDPYGAFTKEQCLLTFLRLYENAPVSRKNGNVESLFTYEQTLALFDLDPDEDVDVGQVSEMGRWEGPKVTAILQLTHGIMIWPTDLYFVYRDGRCCPVDLGLCNIPGGGLNRAAEIKDCAFSDDGETFTCTVEMKYDGVVMGEEDNIVVHPAGIYHITMDVETLEVTQTWEPPVA